MSRCDYFENCEINNDNCSENCNCSINRPMSIIKHYQRKYCKFDSEMCARYKVRTEVGKKYLPSDLLPTNLKRAEEIIEYNK